MTARGSAKAINFCPEPGMLGTAQPSGASGPGATSSRFCQPKMIGNHSSEVIREPLTVRFRTDSAMTPCGDFLGASITERNGRTFLRVLDLVLRGGLRRGGGVTFAGSALVFP